MTPERALPIEQVQHHSRRTDWQPKTTSGAYYVITGCALALELERLQDNRNR
jgi:hypothetical protein